MREDLTTPDLFGNEDGEDEDLLVLQSYFVEKPEFQQFYSTSNRFLVARSRKGMGKSALLRRALLPDEASTSHSIAIYLKGSDLMAIQTIDAKSPHELVY